MVAQLVAGQLEHTVITDTLYNFPKRLESSFLGIVALPNASRISEESNIRSVTGLLPSFGLPVTGSKVSGSMPTYAR